MVDTSIKFGTKEHADLISMVYGDPFIQLCDILERNDFFGFTGKEGIIFMTDKLELTEDSNVLDLCSGIGGAARFLAKKYGCKVTGIDLSEPNYHAAQKRTKSANLDHLVNFIHGNALDIPFPDQSFTNVIGCDAWSYIPDKMELYSSAFRVLKPKGIISFIEFTNRAPKERDVVYNYEKILGKNYLETIVDSALMLKNAGFDAIQYFDTTELTSKVVINDLYKMINKKSKIIKSIGSSGFYHTVLELWAEIVTDLLDPDGASSHSCFIAQKD